MSKLYAEIILPRKIGFGQDTLTYEVPFELIDILRAGDLVEIPLRNKSVRGVVHEIHRLKPLFTTKPVVRKVEDFFSLSGTQLELLKYISSYHFCPLHKSIKLFYPANVFSRKREKIITPPGADSDRTLAAIFTLTQEQQKALDQIELTADKPILLHDITGSGKTEIYRRLTMPCLQKGQQILIMIP